MTAHAVDEMAEDDLDFDDVEHAVLSGQVVHSDFEDPRGPKHVIHGLAADGQVPVGILGRFAKADRFLIITVFEITD
jgi:hypothetical protein